jgi:2-hydroxy-3-oxopropionate reductase
MRMGGNVGFIGLGVMGAPMARNLSRVCDQLVVFDVDESRITGLVRADSTGYIKAAAGVAEVGKGANAVVLSLPNSAIVKEVAVGEAGLAEVMRSGSVIIDTSTTEPAVSIQIADALRARGIAFLDAPVSGGDKAAIDGTLSFMVGGDEDVFNESLELLRAMGSSVVRVGGPGAGEVAKMVNQMIVGAYFAIVAEGFALGTKSGLDPTVLYEAIRGGWAQSKILDVSAAAYFERDFKPGGTVNIHWKDLGYALSLARDQDVPTPVTALVHEVFKAARADGKGALSQPAIVTLWEELLALEVKGGKR